MRIATGATRVRRGFAATLLVAGALSVTSCGGQSADASLAAATSSFAHEANALCRTANTQFAHAARSHSRLDGVLVEVIAIQAGVLKRMAAIEPPGALRPAYDELRAVLARRNSTARSFLNRVRVGEASFSDITDHLNRQMERARQLAASLQVNDCARF